MHTLRLRAAAAAALSLCALAHAQQQPAPGAPASTGELPAVTVQDSPGSNDYVAPKATLGVLGDLAPVEAPFSVNVITRDLLDNQQASTYNDYLKNDPSANTGNVPVGFATLRGFSLGTAGYLYDGLPGSQPLNDGRYQLIGVERIEVYKGPSAFLNGMGSSTSLGGTLNYVPKKPEDGSIRSITAGWTTRTVGSLALDLGDRFGEDKQFGYRLNVGVKDGEQAPRNADWNQQAITLALDWRVNRDLTLSAGTEYAKNHYPTLQPFFLLAPGIDVPAAYNGKTNVAQPWDDFKVEGTNTWLRADWKVAPDWTLSAQGLHSTNYRPNTTEARFGQIYAADGSAFLFGQQDGSSKSIGDTAQLALRGKLQTGSLSHALTFAAAGTDTESKAGEANPLGVFPTNIYAPVDSPTPVAGPTTPLRTYEKTRSTSFLASDIVSFNEQWSALVGFRHARLTVDSYDPLSGALLSSDPLSKTSPVGALMFKPTPSSLVYLNYAQGVEPGGTAPVVATNANQSMPAIVTKQLELGAKLEAGGVLYTAALFDLRKPFETLDPNTLAYTQNGEQRHRGLELLASGQVTRNLSLVTGLMWLDPTVTNTGDLTTEGKRPPGVSRVIANLFADYRIEAVPGLYINGGVYYGGSQFYDGANLQRVPSWTRFDAGLRYVTRIGSAPTTFYFNVENLADKAYWSSALGGVLTVADPRTFKLSARVSF